MCGIAGSINFPLNIPVLTKDLWHRGPDEQSTFSEKNLQLHHHRLSILDIAGGKQPMQSGHLTIIFNGEIYNHLDVRSKYGLVCKTNSDTETILAAYHRKGPVCLNEFDGMFALAIYDSEKQEVFLARDRAGKKPLYYFSDGAKFIFASELNALYSQLPQQLDEENIGRYMRMGYFYKEATPYKNVKELPTGSYMTISLENLNSKLTSWWDISRYYEKPCKDDFEMALYRVDEILHQAIKNRVESSDLEVGSFLSGGIDSGLVTAIGKQYNSSLKTFTVSFQGQYDESSLARLVAAKYETNHHEIRIDFKDLKDEAEKILMNYGEPHYDDSAIPSYYVSREAKKHLTVILNGDGGDELFGGYRRYVPFSKMDFFRDTPVRQRLFKMLYSLVPPTRNKMSKTAYIKRLLFFGSRSGIDTYFSATTDIFEGLEKDVFKNKWEPGNDISREFADILNSSLSGLQKIMLLDFNNILPSLLLVKMDIATMVHSLEGRSPFLSKGLLEYVPSLPDKLKIKGTTTKFLLRKLGEKYLPSQLIYQPKRGFEPPLQQWVNHELRELIGDYLVSNNVLYPSFIKRDFVKGLLDNKIKVASEKRAKMIWLLFTLEVWYRKVYKRNNQR